MFKKKSIAVLVLLCLWVPFAWAQKGTQFRQASLAEIFQAARQAKKAVFVEIYSPTCHVCQSFVPTLNDSRVGAYYNKNFVSTKLDVNQKATQAFLERKRIYVPSLPLFLYFDGNQNLIHMAMSNNSPDEVIRHGSNAMSPAARGQNMKTRFADGERSANFLIDYAMYAKVTRDTATNIRVMEEYARQQPPNAYANNTNWLVLQKLIMDMDNPLFRHMVNNPQAYRQYGMEQARSVAENILMSSLYSSRGLQYPAEKILQVRDQLTKIGIDPKVAANRTLLPEVMAYFRMRQTGKAVARMDYQVNNFPLTVPEFVYIARLFNRNSPDTSDAPTVIRWVNKALAMNKASAKEQADLYYELAEAQRRSGKTADALRAAQKSMELAQNAQLDTRRNVEQLARLK